MSIPSIPGYTGNNASKSLGALWVKPDGSYPPELWPSADLDMIDPLPGGWVTILEHTLQSNKDRGVKCVLIPADKTVDALKESSWIGRDLGEVGFWEPDKLEYGLVEEDDVQAEFFVQARHAAGRSMPHLEISYPFLWYWDAYEIHNSWKYSNGAGREVELIRYEITEKTWKVEVRALELRTFLATAGKAAVIQLDNIRWMREGSFDRVDDSHKCDWAHFSFYAVDDVHVPERPVLSRLMGQYVIQGQRTSQVARWQEPRDGHKYPAFIYEVDSDSGSFLTHNCDPAQLGTYYDKDSTRLHFLTPIYFNRAVLQSYVSEPGRYSLSRSRISCLNLWGLDISFNSVGLVEAYLGDLGQSLPSAEWGLWQTHNVPPEGKMDEGRFRRDFLNQWASSNDPMSDLQQALNSTNEAATKRFGAPLWRILPESSEREFQSLIGPLSNDLAALNAPVITLTKTLVDNLDSSLLKRVVVSKEKGDQSLGLLQKCLDEIGDRNNLSKIFRDLQNLRSSGGIAHLPGSKSAVAQSFMNTAELGIVRAFDELIVRLATVFSQIAELLGSLSDDKSPESEIKSGS